MARKKTSPRGRRKTPKRSPYALCSVAVALLLIIVNLPGLTSDLPEDSSAPPEKVVNSGTDIQFADPVLTAPPEFSGAPDADTQKKENVPVGDEYFADAIFIGNSRTEGFLMYSGVKPLRGYAELGLTVNTVFTDLATHIDGQYMPIMEAVRRQPDFAKAYIMLGMNELGWAYQQPYIDGYSKIIDTIREANPEAIIYVQSILPVTEVKSAEDEYINNPRINEYNARLRAMCEEKDVTYLNVAEALMDEETGALPAEASLDGVHMQKEYCQIWYEYLKAHTTDGHYIPEE